MGHLYTLLIVVFLLSVAVSHDRLTVSPVEEISVRHRYSLATWEATRFPVKWMRKVGNFLFPYKLTAEDQEQLVLDFFSMDREADRLQAQVNMAAAAGSADLQELEELLKEVQRRLADIQPEVEESLESAISDVLRQQGIASIGLDNILEQQGVRTIGLGPVIFPPVDFILDPLPTILIVSPRDRIERLETVLLEPNLLPSERAILEEEILERENLSSLVQNIGGLATFPNIIALYDLRTTMNIASHEWLHSYLFFHPLGRNYQRNADMNILNETTANIFGEEMGRLLVEHITGEHVPPPTPGGVAAPCPEDRFCFSKEMRETRLTVDDLLAEGKVDDAEAYMEERRQLFVDNGYSIRKLNQAYFAFHGTYGDSPSSVSPIHGQLQRLREASDSLAEFIHTVQGVSSYQGFLRILDEKGLEH